MYGKEFLGKTVEEAIEEGLKELGLTQEQAEITVLEEGKKSLFKSVKARVLVAKKLTPGEKAVKFLEGLLDIMKKDAVVQLESEGDKIVINLISQDSANLIGYRGEMLDTLQNLAGAVANTGAENYKRLVIDCEGYRQKREETLINLAKNLEKKAVRTGKDVKIEPMSAYERRLIHSALADSTKVTTKSDGKEPFRYVVIIPNEKKAFNKEKSFNKGGKKDFKRDGKGTLKKYDQPQSAPRKKGITFGTYLGNSGNKGE